MEIGVTVIVVIWGEYELYISTAGSPKLIWIKVCGLLLY